MTGTIRQLMNRFPVAWPVALAVPELRALPSDQRVECINRLRRLPPTDNVLLRRSIALAMLVPYLLVFCLPVALIVAGAPDSIDFASIFKFAAPLLLAAIYVSLCAFSFLNARTEAPRIRAMTRGA